MRMDRPLAHAVTARYAAVQGAYFIGYGAIYSFASAFLLARGFANSQIGIIIALSNVIAAFVQPAVASYADRPGAVPVKYLTAGLTALGMALSVLLLVLPVGLLSTALFEVLIVTLELSVQPLISAMGFEHINRGVNVNYGLARSAGSIAYAVLTFVLGQIITFWGEDVLPLSYVLVFALFLAATLSFPRPPQAAPDDRAGHARAAGSPAAFFRRYPGYAVMLIGLTLIFTQHYAQNNYLLQIVRHLGGDSGDFGIAISLSAVMELPTMLAFSYLVRRFPAGRLLLISCVCYLGKAVMMTLATGVPMVFASQGMQMLAFALYTPASVYYANSSIADEDKVKGQAYLTVTMMLGGVFGSLSGGWLIDSFGFAVMQRGLTVVSAAGVLIAGAGICKNK